jgi:hypothetical protein
MLYPAELRAPKTLTVFSISISDSACQILKRTENEQNKQVEPGRALKIYPHFWEGSDFLLDFRCYVL